ncbi:MAG: DUF7033 domain-containing protein, partial [Bacteroidota bacterium]
IINYSERFIENTFHILPHGLLDMSGSYDFRLIKSHSTYGTLVIGNQKKPADLFSAIFYFISRAEEWQNRFRDVHNRFCKDSIFSDEFDFTESYVDQWIEEFRVKLNHSNTHFEISKPEFKCTYTFDIDNGFAFLGKPLWKTVLTLVNDVIHLNFLFVKHRINTLRGITIDPFDQYENIIQHILKYKLNTVFFFLVNRKVKFDRGANLNSKVYANLFKKIRQSNITSGLHPSYTSFEASHQMEYERTILETQLAKTINISRQHFLKFNMRYTPLALLKAGITEDWSMGFSDILGFRARTTHAFLYFNFDTEHTEPICLKPFCIMDGVFYIHQGVSALKAKACVDQYKNRIQKTGGNFVMVFHERIFSELHHPGFSKFFFEITETVS